MARVHAQDTSPEIVVRRLLHKLGYRYRLYSPDLPGKPDLVFRSRRKVVFVHGCFWHQHDACSKARRPSTHTDYWLPKLSRNRQRDVENLRTLERLGWSALVIWQCELRNIDDVVKSLVAFLNPPPAKAERGAADPTQPATASLGIR